MIPLGWVPGFPSEPVLGAGPPGGRERGLVLERVLLKALFVVAGLLMFLGEWDLLAWLGPGFGSGRVSRPCLGRTGSRVFVVESAGLLPFAGFVPLCMSGVCADSDVDFVSALGVAVLESFVVTRLSELSAGLLSSLRERGFFAVVSLEG